MGIPVRAIKNGYYGSILRVPGEKHQDFEIASEGEFAKSWMEKRTGKSEAPAKPPAPATGGDAPPAVVAIPADWRTMHHKKREALAKAISGLGEVSTEQALAIIGAEVDQRDAVPRGMAKGPVTKTAEELAAEVEAKAIADAQAIAAEADGDPETDTDI